MKSDLSLWPGSHIGNYRILLLLKCLIQLLTAPHVTLWLCSWGCSSPQPDTPTHTWCPASPWKAEAALWWTSHPRNKETAPLVLSVPAFVKCNWLSCSEQTPHSALASAQFWGAPCTHLCSPRNRFCKGHTFLFFFFNLQGTQPQVPLARGYTHSLLNQWKAHQEAPGQCPPSTFLEFAPYALPAGAVLLLPCKAQELKLFLEHQKQKCSGLGLLRVWGFLQLQYGNRMFFLNTDLPMCCCKLRTGSEGETVWTQQQPRPVFL